MEGCTLLLRWFLVILRLRMWCKELGVNSPCSCLPIHMVTSGLLKQHFIKMQFCVHLKTHKSGFSTVSQVSHKPQHFQIKATVLDLYLLQVPLKHRYLLWLLIFLASRIYTENLVLLRMCWKYLVLGKCLLCRQSWGVGWNPRKRLKQTEMGKWALNAEEECLKGIFLR